MPNKNKLEIISQITDPARKNRLVLNFEEVRRPGREPDARGFDFHSLVWKEKCGRVWKPRIAISKDAFQSGYDHRRWPIGIHSLQVEVGEAIIKVGEECPRNEAGVVRVTYTWRQWSLENNSEIRIIQVCRSPFEEFETSGDNDEASNER